MIETVNAVLSSRNLKVNEDKTKYNFLQRGHGNTEKKQLAISNMNKLQAVWIRRDHVSEEKRLRLYSCLVLLVLLYNC